MLVTGDFYLSQILLAVGGKRQLALSDSKNWRVARVLGVGEFLFCADQFFELGELCCRKLTDEIFTDEGGGAIVDRFDCSNEGELFA